MYLEDAHQQSPFIVLSTVGFSGHGKTVYLASLIHTLDRLCEFWPGFSRYALNLASVIEVRKSIEMLGQGELPGPSLPTFPEPSIHMLEEIPGFGSRLMLTYDASGESFRRGQIKDHAGFIKRSQTVFFLIDLDYLSKKSRPADEMHELLNIYVVGMADLGGNTKEQHLIIVYAKGDLLYDKFRNHPQVLKYLKQDELPSPDMMDRYLRNMTIISQQLVDFTRQIGATKFITLAKKKFASVEYCVVSALGQPPIKVDGEWRLGFEISPRRVIDPLLWVIQKSTSSNSSRRWWLIGLIITLIVWGLACIAWIVLVILLRRWY